MTTFAYPLYTRQFEIPISATQPQVSAAVLQIVQASVDFSQVPSSASTSTVNGPVLPKGARVSNIYADVPLVWNSVSGTKLTVAYQGGGILVSGLDLETAGRKTGTLGAANVSVANVILTANTTLTFTVSVDGSVVPSAGRAVVYVEYY